MPAMKLKVTFTAGQAIEIKISPRAQVNTEVHIGGEWSRMSVLSMYHMAWGTLRKSDPENTPDFDTWLDTVEAVEQVEEEKPDPTPPDHSEGTSYL